MIAGPAKKGLGKSVLGEAAYLSREYIDNRSVGLLARNLFDIPIKFRLGNTDKCVAKEIFNFRFVDSPGTKITCPKNIPVPESVDQCLLFGSLVSGIIGV